MGRTNKAICEGNELLWVLPKDHKMLKDRTMGHTLIMGRKTYESIGHPLRGRVNIVVTRNLQYKPNIPPGFESEIVIVANSTEDALKKGREEEKKINLTEGKVFIFGGGEIYSQMLKDTNEIYATLVDSDKEGTAHFPHYEVEFDIVSEKRDLDVDKLDNKLTNFSWVDLKRKDSTSSSLSKQRGRGFRLSFFAQGRR